MIVGSSSVHSVHVYTVIISKYLGCGNTMPDLSNLVPFHSGQVENFYLLVLGQVQMYIVNKVLYITCCIENSMDPDQLASSEAS